MAPGTLPELLERRIGLLRRDKKNVEEGQYYASLEPLLLDLARLYDELDALLPEDKPPVVDGDDS